MWGFRGGRGQGNNEGPQADGGWTVGGMGGRAERAAVEGAQGGWRGQSRGTRRGSEGAERWGARVGDVGEEDNAGVGGGESRGGD